MQINTPFAKHRNALRVIQISDCHLAAEPDMPYRGRNADAGLRSLVPAIVAWRPDLILATGDLSEDGSAASYERLACHLRPIDAPIIALAGNHDDPAHLQRHFPEGPQSGIVSLRIGGWQMVLLNSARPGRIDGAISQDDIQQLQQLLDTDPDRPAVLALHHQPVPLGSPWIDRHMLKAPGKLLDLVTRRKQIRAIVWGHVHQAFESWLGNALMFACPSTAANSLAGTLRFVDDPDGPACRWLQLHATGMVESGLLRAR